MGWAWVWCLTVWVGLEIGGFGSSLRNGVLHGFSQQRETHCFPAIFSFGSSIADTGTKAVALPSGKPGGLPFSSPYFGKPSKRYSDGRLVIDFWSLALGLPYLDPYLKSVGSSYHRGVNFAAAGATANNDTTLSPFSLSTQLFQFREFKHDVLSLLDEGPGLELPSNKHRNANLPQRHYFRDGLYVISIGSNDFVVWYLVQSLSFQEVELKVHTISNSILHVVEALYAEGARNILVEDLAPQGCNPQMLTIFAREFSNELDSAGCMKPFNDMIQLHNSLLRKRILDLGKRLTGASIAVVGTYNKRYDIIVNPGKYGFSETLRACCGAGGEYNFRSDCTCGNTAIVNGRTITTTVCDNTSSHVMWDGVHFTDAANHVIFRDILSGGLFEPAFDIMRNACSLNKI